MKKIFNFEKYKLIFEALSERTIPNILKDISKILKDDFNKNDMSSYNKTFEIDAFLFNIKINTSKTSYYSNVNIFDIITNPTSNINISVDIPSDYDVDYLVATIIHELRHIYDIYTINSDNDMQSFVNDFYIRKLRVGNYTNFINLIYLSLEHELVARNNMIYPFIIDKNLSKEDSLKLVKNSFIYKSLDLLNNFNHINFINSINMDELVRLTNMFIEQVAKDKNICENKNDIITFYKTWEDYFKSIKKEWEIEILSEISKIYEFKTYNEDIIGGTHRLFGIIYKKLFNTR